MPHLKALWLSVQLGGEGRAWTAEALLGTPDTLKTLVLSCVLPPEYSAAGVISRQSTVQGDASSGDRVAEAAHGSCAAEGARHSSVSAVDCSSNGLYGTPGA